MQTDTDAPTVSEPTATCRLCARPAPLARPGLICAECWRLDPDEVRGAAFALLAALKDLMPHLPEAWSLPDAGVQPKVAAAQAAIAKAEWRKAS